MNIQDFSSDFTIFVLSQDADLGSRVKLTLSQHRYDAFFFADPDELFLRVQSEPPHIIIIDQEALTQDLALFAEKIISVSSEIRMIILTQPEHFSNLVAFRKYNVSLFFDRGQETVSMQVLFAVDQICESLYRLYQNENVFELYQSSQKEFSEIQKKIAEERQGPQVRPFQMRIAEYKMSESKEELLQKFYQQSPKQSWVFLKYIKSIQTYISVSHQNMEPSWVEGLSFKIPTDVQEFNSRVFVGDFPDSLISYIKTKWDVSNLKILPLTFKDEIEGLLISTQDISADVAEDFSLMSLVYQLMALESQPLHLDVEDPLTGFYNQLFYKRVLDKEIDRSKRTLAPISVVKVAIDSFAEIEASQGRVFTDEVIKKISQVISASSRLPDYACRTNENEFSLVLTNCNRKGAALRAERLRQVLKTESFSRSGFVITVSQGISEYPSLTRTAQSLDESASKALNFISSKGGDKICIYKAPQDHQPDFQVNT
ncbi:MAG: hypothetical protein A2622_02660 [Bdellovibrionales bacterium RIFCSPHIGHO2_01_FULL_40_29]|nr:MAG: hypothetical protein A2622_02660 [Bdellovibrionales bacterium RIFCSPHIGHO2_01_FULL_40_29]OFZ33981.1 MAG: hypothetical protein A3D17_03080 [Bdellovibrionales bacterium RIFCSPHIGHO2_02_FULL_40_15]